MFSVPYPNTFFEGRDTFLDAADNLKRSGKVAVNISHLPIGEPGPDGGWLGLGPNGEELTIAVCKVGDPKASKVIIEDALLHGLERNGSFLLSNRLWALTRGEAFLPPDTCLVLIEGICAWGASHFTRDNYNGNDLNRVWCLPGFYNNLPEAPGIFTDYATLFAQTELNEGTINFISAEVDKIWGIKDEKDIFATQLFGGNFTHPGFFFGGNKPDPIVEPVKALLGDFLRTARFISHRNNHSGLGDQLGVDQILVPARKGSDMDQLARKIYGDDDKLIGNMVKDNNTSISTVVAHPLIGVWNQFDLGDTTVLAVGDEYGTVPQSEIAKTIIIRNLLREEGEKLVGGEKAHPLYETVIERCDRAFNPRETEFTTNVAKNGHKRQMAEYRLFANLNF